MKLIIVRHAETNHNAQGIISRNNAILTSLGKKQASKLADRLLKEKIDVIYCSDLRRCKQTIAPFLKLQKIPISYHKELRERRFGRFEGKPGSYLVKWVEQNKLRHRYGPIPGGESVDEVRERTSKILKEIIDKNKDKNVLIVSHGGTKVAIMLNLFKKETVKFFSKYRSANTGLSIVSIKDDGNHRARLISSVKHLGDLK